MIRTNDDEAVPATTALLNSSEGSHQNAPGLVYE
jgi:hypothetical protein